MKLLSTLFLVAFLHVPLFSAQPNIVFILADDMGYGDLGCYGHPRAKTPVIDQLAKDGVRFTQHYSNGTECSPTRTAFLTGRYPQRAGGLECAIGTGNVGRYDDAIRLAGQRQLGLPAKQVILPSALKPAGYVSCHIGKWHLGADDWYPQKQGYDFNFGGCDYGQPPNYFDPFNQPKGRHPMIRAGIPHLPGRKKGQYLSDREAEEAVAFIEKHKDQPFFLNMDNYAVHTPIQAKAEVTAKYEKKPKTTQKNAKYAAMVESVDDCAGRIMETLEKHGIADRTVIIFTSDNGFYLGEHGLAGKWFMHEESIRLPLVICDPRLPRKEAGRRVSEPALNIDIAPTILELAGLSVPATVQGRSLVPLLQRRRVAWRTEFFYEHPFRHPRIPMTEGVRGVRWKYVRYTSLDPVVEELYDLKTDPREEKNLAKDSRFTERLNEQRSKWQKWRKRVK